jgi:hypothetical protein
MERKKKENEKKLRRSCGKTRDKCRDVVVSRLTESKHLRNKKTRENNVFL